MKPEQIVEDEPLAPVRVARAFALTVVGFCAFALAAAAIGPLAPAPDLDVIDLKMDEIRQDLNEWDTLFIGSSQVACTLDPSRFDDTTAAHGAATRSYNFGVAGAHAQEIEVLLIASSICGRRNSASSCSFPTGSCRGPSRRTIEAHAPLGGTRGRRPSTRRGRWPTTAAAIPSPNG